MPYNSGGVYVGPSGSTDAAPGQTIRSATWDTINLDYATALTAVGQQLWNGPVTVTASYTVATTIASVIANAGGDITLTLAAASTVPGYRLLVKTVPAYAVVSSASVVAPLTATTPGTAILAATAGKWAALQSDGTNWVVMMAN